MALSPSAAWKSACLRAGAELRFLVEITDSVYSYKSLSGSVSPNSDLYGTVEAVREVAPVGADLDPLTREMQSQELFVDFDDAYIRPIIVNNRIKGQKIVVTLGEYELNEADYVSFFAGPIQSFIPQADKVVRLSVLDLFTVLDQTEITGYWAAVHPLEVLYKGDGTGILERAEIPAAMIDTASFDHTAAGYADIAHWRVSRGPPVGLRDTAVREPTSALELAREICSLLYGHLVTDETGKITFVRFDSTASAVTHWNDDDIIAGSFEQDEEDENIINRVVVNFGLYEGNGLEKTYEANDTASQSTYAFPGASDRIFTHSVDYNWINGHPTIRANIDDGTLDDSFEAWGWCHSFSGTDAAYPPSAARPCYLLLDHWDTLIDESEIVKATDGSLSTAWGLDINYTDPGDGSYNTLSYKRGMTYGSGGTPLARGQLNTTAQAHNTVETWVWDVTIPVIYADEILARFRNGCPIITLETLLTEYAVQVGDMVTVTNTQYIGYGKDGLTSEKFEVIGKEVDIFNSEPKIKWKLASASTSALTRTGRADFGDGSTFRDVYVGSGGEDFTRPHVTTGLAVSDGGGFVATVAVGTASTGLYRKSLPTAHNITCSANKDTYISYDPFTGEIGYTETALGAGTPTLPPTDVMLAKVVTDGAGVSSVTDLRVTTALNGSHLIDATVDSDQIAALAVTTAKIDSNAVTTAKVGLNAIGTAQTVADVGRRIHNLDFSMWTRG